MSNVIRAVLMGTSISLNAAPVLANELRLETLRTYVSPGQRTVRVDARVRWKNAWRNARNHDAVWLVVKVRANPRGEWSHAKLARAALANPSPVGACQV